MKHELNLWHMKHMPCHKHDDNVLSVRNSRVSCMGMHGHRPRKRAGLVTCNCRTFETCPKFCELGAAVSVSALSPRRTRVGRRHEIELASVAHDIDDDCGRWAHTQPHQRARLPFAPGALQAAASQPKSTDACCITEHVTKEWPQPLAGRSFSAARLGEPARHLVAAGGKGRAGVRPGDV